MNFNDIRIIHKKGDEINKIESFFVPNWITETYAWRFDYKGKKYGSAIAGTSTKPITDEDVIVLMEHMIASMKKIKGEYNARERYKSDYRDTV